MKEYHDIIEKTCRKCASRLKGITLPEKELQEFITNIQNMQNPKDAMDLLALRVDGLMGKTQPEDFQSSIRDIMQIDKSVYSSSDELLAQLQRNKQTNYTPGNISVGENHRLIEETLRKICGRLNESGVDYYVVGALSTFIATQTPLFRYHGDIDFMLAEKDIEKAKQAFKDSDYVFSDDRYDNKRTYNESVGHAQGEHEVIANHKNNEFHIGFFLFEREPDGSMDIREYFMEERQNGTRVPKVLERHMPRELVELEYSGEFTEFAGTRFRTATPESVYMKNISSRHSKHELDRKALDGKVDFEKMEQLDKYQTTTRIIDVVPEKAPVLTTPEMGRIAQDERITILREEAKKQVGGLEAVPDKIEIQTLDN